MNDIVLNKKESIERLVLEGQLSFSEMLDRKIKVAQTRGLIYVHPISGIVKGK